MGLLRLRVREQESPFCLMPFHFVSVVAPTDLIRHGEEKATLELEIQLNREQRERILPIVEEADIDLDEQLFIKRIIARNGRHRIYLNGQRVSLSVLTSISKGLVDIIGQHASHALLSTDSHIGNFGYLQGYQKIPMLFLSKSTTLEHCRGK